MEIYAELDSKTLRKIEEGHELVLPLGAKISRKKGSRMCYFACDEFYKQEMIEFLDDNGISWQEMIEEWGINKKEEKPSKKKGFGEFIDPWEQKERSSKKGGFRDFTDPWNK